MPDEFPSPLPLLADGYLRSALDWQNIFTQSLMQAQSNQLRLLSAWQQSLFAINQDLWDRWICRFGGGVPIDG